MKSSIPSESVAPDSLPKYLTDGLPKQDRETLKDVREYVEALLNYHALLDEQPIDESSLPEDAELVEETPKGSIMNEFRPAATRAATA